MSISKDLLVFVEKEVEALGKVTKEDEDVMEKNTESDGEATQGAASKNTTKVTQTQQGTCSDSVIDNNDIPSNQDSNITSSSYYIRNSDS